MLFDLSNAPTTFCTLMNETFHSYLDWFVVLYLDDIVVYSHTFKEHIDHLCIVFKALRDNELYVKKETRSFESMKCSSWDISYYMGWRALMDESKF